MIQIHESSNWIAQHQITLSLVCLIGVVLSLSVFITASSFVLQKKRFIKHSKAIVSISLGILIISSCLLFAISAKGPHYSGSAEYTIDNVKQNASRATRL
jgi:membrane protein CcdC involved in cytochrome C biogenesis